MEKGVSRYFFSVIILCLGYCDSYSQSDHLANPIGAGDKFEPYPMDIGEELRVFNDGIKTGARYLVSLCADVPNNKKPLQVAHRQECGHVFLILQKIHDCDTLSEVFGFYPKSGMSVLFFKRNKSRIKDNSRRDYDVQLTKELTAEGFDTLLSRSVLQASHVYHINKFNCYDYAVDVFDSIAGQDSIPRSRIRYPLFLGKGGSPCCIYKDLKKLKESNSVWAPNIRFGEFTAPVSTGRTNKGINKKRNIDQ